MASSSPLSLQKSTSICERVTCQPLPCNSESQVVPDGECCPQCGRERVFSSCVVAGQKYKVWKIRFFVLRGWKTSDVRWWWRCDVFLLTVFQEGETWKRNPCTTCECLKGKPLCVIDQCNPNLVCPAGYKIESAPGDCCPKCVKGMVRWSLPSLGSVEALPAFNSTLLLLLSSYFLFPASWIQHSQFAPYLAILTTGRLTGGSSVFKDLASTSCQKIAFLAVFPFESRMTPVRVSLFRGPSRFSSKWVSLYGLFIRLWVSFSPCPW